MPIGPRKPAGEAPGEPTGEPKEPKKARSKLSQSRKRNLPPPDTAPASPPPDAEPVTPPPDAAPAEPTPAPPEPDPVPTPDAPPPAEPVPAEPKPLIPVRRDVAGKIIKDGEPPATPEPATPPAEPAPTTPETPPATPEAPPVASKTPESKSRWKSITSTFTEAYNRFKSKFRGEVEPEEEKKDKASWGDVAKNAASGFLSVAASYTGVKIIADLPQWLYQKYWTNPAERKSIHSQFAEKTSEWGKDATTAFEQRRARLEKAIDSSKFLTKEKQKALLKQLKNTAETYKDKLGEAAVERDEAIAKLIDQAIETRVKNTQVLKEGLNSALMITGLAAMRGVAYGAVASYERYKQVAQERTEGKRKGGQFNEWIVKGFTETLHNIGGGGAETWAGKGVNMVKGWTNVMRAAGFADLAAAEMLGEGFGMTADPMEQLEKFANDFKEKGPGVMIDNALAPWERLAGFARGDIRPFGLGRTAENAEATEPAAGTSGAGAPETAGGAGGTPEAAGAAGAGAAGVAAESAPHVEIPEAQIEAGLVKKGDGILKILARQDVEAKSALEAAREAGILRAGGDTRLTTLAIGRLSVFTETQPDGDIEIKFFDSETDKLLTLEEAREAGFTYESGTVPGEIPTDKEIVEHTPEPTPETATFTDSPAPNDLLGGTFHIDTDAEGRFTNLEIGDGDPIGRMRDAIQELDQQGHGNSPEVLFILQKMGEYSELEGVDPAPADLSPAQAAQRTVEEVRAHEAALPEAPVDGEPLHKFKGEAGKVKFIYNDDGTVKYARMPAYMPGRRDIEDSLKEWGLTIKEVKAHFFEGASRTHMDGTAIDTSHAGRYPGVDRPGFPIQSPEGDYRQFVRVTERLDRQEALLKAMEEQGHLRTPEYAHLKMETQKLESSVADEMKKEFNIKKRPI